MSSFNIDDKVAWNWGNGTGTGTIVEVVTQKVTKTIKGTEVTRDASKDAPAYMIKQSDGDTVLKSGSELTKV